jgi:hypothetical protein
MASFTQTFVRTRQGILLGVGFLILVLLGAAIVWLVNQASADAQQVAHTLTVQDKLSNVLLGLRRAEAGQRGNLFTNQQVYLDDYNAAEPEVNVLLNELTRLTSDNPEREKQLARLAELTNAKFREMDKTIALNASGDRETARTLVLGGSGRDVMNDVRVLIEQATADEGRLLTLRANRSRGNNQLLLAMALIGSVLIILIGVLSVYLVQRNSRGRERAQYELAATNSNLERIVDYRTADLKEANDEIQRFAYIVSHDLRSPLVNIMGFTAELEALRGDIFAQVSSLREQLAALNAQTEQKNDGAEGEARDINELGKDFDEALAFIKTSISKMDRLINAVLKLSREGRREFHPETIDMNDLLKSITDTVAHRAIEQGATIELRDLPPVQSDRLALEQVFSNLVDNAIKYSRSSEAGRIEISSSESPNHVIFEVRDNGRGIDPRDHTRVFELFRRSGPQDRPGEGIGLAHVRALVRRLGGNMGLTSELGQGSTFTVTLPRRWTTENRSAA